MGKETFVPKAYLFFMNIKSSEDRRRKSSKTSSTDVKPKATANKKPLMVKSNKNHTKLSPKSTITIQEDEPSTPQMNGQIIKTPPTADPIAGRYRLLKTENFDEFMKRLGVGLIK